VFALPAAISGIAPAVMISLNSMIVAAKEIRRFQSKTADFVELLPRFKLETNFYAAF